MSQDHPIYDLGDVDVDQPPSAFPPLFDTSRPHPSSRASSRRVDPVTMRRSASRGASRPGGALAASLSMFVPGLGQLIAGEVAWGLFYASGIGLCAAIAWAAVTSLDRLVPTLRFLDVPAQAVAVTLLGAASIAMMLHLAAVLHAHALGEDSERGSLPHPIVAGIASLLVPGWGQLLAGHRRRAALFLASVWILGGAWLVVLPAAGRVLAKFGAAIPEGLRDGWGPIALLALPVVLWVIAVYDGAAGAASERAQSA